jgi:hypothetical protein
MTVERVDNPIHCAFLSPTMAFRPLLRQVSSMPGMPCIAGPSVDVLQRAAVPAMAAVLSAAVAFAPRTADAEEPAADLLVRVRATKASQAVPDR